MILRLAYSATNTYLIRGSRGSLLFDTGWAGTFPRFCKALGEQGATLSEIRYLLISHYHPDHMGIAQEIASHGVTILVPEVQRPFLHSADAVFEKEGEKGFLPIRDGEIRVISLEESRAFLDELGISGEILSTPGHTDDSISLWLDEGTALVGDLNPLYELELHRGTQIARSWDILLARKPSRICYGHAREATLAGDSPDAPIPARTDATGITGNSPDAPIPARTDATGITGNSPDTPMPSQTDATDATDASRREADLYALTARIMKYIDKGWPLARIQEKTGADMTFVNDVARMYLTHRNVGVQGILDRIEIKGR